ENKNWNREVYHPKTLSGLSGEAIVVEVFKPFSGSINDVIVNVFKTNVLSTEGLAVHSSSRGPAPQLIVKPDVTAPGKEICAARVSDSSILENKFNCKLTCGNDNYISCSGTSMATPHVAGLVALLKEADSNLEVDDVREALRKADNKLILSSNPDNVEGDGRINSRKAGDSVTNCGSYEAYDLYDSGNEPKVYGSCCEHSWSGDRCIEACHDDYCNGDQVYEYYAFGSKCIKSLEDCRYGTDWTCSNGKCVYSPPPPPDDGGNGGGCNGPCGCQPCTTPI
ncbi:MAG: S8 family serine peptidase, partial [Candidatus Aenigmarchaeota archaeon]|nr:S8 family serine peptidase [Candidatus Aenigmarchaeota archaeon]